MGSMMQLPPGTSKNLAVVHPTQEELEIQFKHNGAEWSGALTTEAYIRREAHLANQDLTRDGGITYWILIDKTNHNAIDPSSKARLPLASCETFRKRALVWRDGKVEETITHGIGSVFCAKHLRGNGYAQRMMEEVGKALQTYQTGDKECLFSVLYSDIGKKFYKTWGWEPYKSSHISVPARKAAVDGLPSVRPLYREDLRELCEIDERRIRKSLESRNKDSKIAVALCPDIETIRWHHAREEFVGKELHQKEPQIKGAMVGNESGKRVWCYWTRVWYNKTPSEVKGNTFHILRVVVEDEQQDNSDAIAAMLALAQQDAQEWNMEDVQVWNPSEETLAAAQKLHTKVEVVDRDEESIACLRWYPEHEGSTRDAVDWVCIEKYVWC